MVLKRYLIHVPFQTKASEESLGWFEKVAAECVLNHMNRRSKNFQFEELIAPLLSICCCSFADERKSK